MEKIRVGIIGCGVIAPTHIEAYQKHDDVEVVWLCDLIEEKALTLSRKYRVANVTTPAATFCPRESRHRLAASGAASAGSASAASTAHASSGIPSSAATARLISSGGSSGRSMR